MMRTLIFLGCIAFLGVWILEVSSKTALESVVVLDEATTENLLTCANQTQCIRPYLQLNKKMKVYLCKMVQNYGRSFHSLIEEGLSLHPNVELVPFDDIASADVIIRPFDASPSAEKSECHNTAFLSKTIVLDDNDRPMHLHSSMQTWHWMYFKRSFASKSNGYFENYTFIPNSPYIYPLTYSLRERHLGPQLNRGKRSIDIFATMKPSKPIRRRVNSWIVEYGKDRKNLSIVTYKQAVTLRHKWNSDQLQPKRNSKILISVNPDRWEGDYRIWDGFSSGALVFIDPLFVPSPFPFIDGQHVIFYNPHNQSEFIQKVEYYLNHPEEARVIAERGYLHAMRFHRSVNLVDYILISAHLKKVAEKNERLSKMSVEDKEVEKYRYTAQDLLMECRVQGPMVRTCQRPPLLPQPHEVQASRRLQC